MLYKQMNMSASILIVFRSVQVKCITVMIISFFMNVPVIGVLVYREDELIPPYSQYTDFL